MSNIFTPRVCLDIAARNKHKQVCTKIPYKGFEISIAMDDSLVGGDLMRSDIRIFDAADQDVTHLFFPRDYRAPGEGLVIATGETLRDALLAIDKSMG